MVQPAGSLHEVESLRRAASAARASGPGNLSNVELFTYTPAGSALAGLSCAGALNTYSGTRKTRYNGLHRRRSRVPHLNPPPNRDLRLRIEEWSYVETQFNIWSLENVPPFNMVAMLVEPLPVVARAASGGRRAV